jgi:uncharacterized damage-inducible protein DinB
VIDRAFLDFSAAKLRQYVDRIAACVDRLSDDQIWSRGHASENSIGNLCLHLSGNIRQWILSGVGNTKDVRDRDSEFAAKGGVPPAELITQLRVTVEAACHVISSLPAARLEDKITVQGYHQTVLEAVYHVVEHFAGHTGQIIFATKALQGEDLGFYRHLSQPQHNEATP